MKIGGAPELLLRLRDLKDIDKKLPEPVRILGNGSNILIDDQGLKGTVIVVRDLPPAEPEVLGEDLQSVWLRASAGIFLPSLCRWAERKALSGCEFMIGIPGTLGGAVVQNAGANEQEVSQILESVEIFDLKDLKSFEISAKDLKFSYRHSRWKDENLSWLVVSAQLRLKKSELQAISAQIQKNLDYRRQKTPYQKPSLGSVWTRLPVANGGWIFPGKLIEDSGLKGLQIGDAKISEVHANYIINEGSASFDQVMELMLKVEAEVLKKQGIALNREILIWSDRF